MVGFSQAVPVPAQVWGQVVHMWRRFAKWHAKGVHGDYVHPEGGGVFGPRSETRVREEVVQGVEVEEPETGG